MSNVGLMFRLRGGGRFLAFGALAVMGVAPSLFAQCATCYTAASAAGEKGMRAIDFGILVLLFPALLLFVSVLWLLRRRARVPFAHQSEPPRVQALPTRDPFPLT